MGRISKFNLPTIQPYQKSFVLFDFIKLIPNLKGVKFSQNGKLEKEGPLSAESSDAAESSNIKVKRGNAMIRYILAWVPMLLIAIANGALRQLTFAKVMTEPHAHQLSTVLGAACIGVFIWFVVRAWPPASGRQALFVGLMWVLLTVVFESFMGLVLQHRPLMQILHEYNLLAGRVWILFLVWLAVAPWVFFRLRHAK
jgi:hypothetical protein